MKTTVKTLAAASLTLALAVSLAACGTTSTPATNGTPQTQAQDVKAKCEDIALHLKDPEGSKPEGLDYEDWREQYYGPESIAYTTSLHSVTYRMPDGSLKPSPVTKEINDKIEEIKNNPWHVDCETHPEQAQKVLDEAKATRKWFRQKQQELKSDRGQYVVDTAKAQFARANETSQRIINEMTRDGNLNPEIIRTLKDHIAQRNNIIATWNPTRQELATLDNVPQQWQPLLQEDTPDNY